MLAIVGEQKRTGGARKVRVVRRKTYYTNNKYLLTI